MKDLAERNKLWQARWDVYYSVKALIKMAEFIQPMFVSQFLKLLNCKFAEEEKKNLD